MLRNGIGSDIFVESSLLKWAIWLWMYIRKVREDQRPIFMIVVSDCPCNFNAIAPPARSECTPMRSGSIPALSSCSSLMACRSAVLMSVDVTCFHWSFSQ